MRKSCRIFLISIPVILTILLSNLSAIPVYADDAAPPVEQTEVAVTFASTDEASTEQQSMENPSLEASQSPDPEEDGQEPETPVDDQSPQETPQATEEPSAEVSPEATVEETVDITVEPTERSVEETLAVSEEPTPEFSAEELDTLPEILQAVPEGTELIVLDAEGQPESLASEAAAQTLVEGDPMWCPQGATPGDAGCTGSYGTFAELIAFLEADASGSNTYTGNGVIWVANTYINNDGSQINLNGDRLSNISSNNLTITGGWVGTIGSTAVSGVSSANVSLSINAWRGNITVQNIFIANTEDNQGFGLYVETDGDTTLENVHADGSTNGNSGIIIYESNDVLIDNTTASNNEGSGIWINNSGNVSIENSTFNENGFNGIAINSDDAVLLDNIDVSNNSLNGAIINAANDVFVTSSHSPTFYSQFNENGSNGLDIHSGGSIILTSLDANGNYTGMVLDTTQGDGDIFIEDVYAVSNTGTGIHAESGGLIGAFANIVSANGELGLYANSQGEGIFIFGSEFSANNIGLQTQANDGITLISQVVSNNNISKGAYLNGSGESPIIIIQSMFNGNGDYGIYATTDQGSLLGDILSTLGGVPPSIPGGSLPSDIGTDTSIGIAVLLTDVSGNGTGATLINKGAGLIGVAGSNFDINNRAGLSIFTSSDVILGGNFFTNNGGNGAEVFSTYTAKGCYCPGDTKTSITVEARGGDFVNNGQWGLMVNPGPEGDLIFDETTPTKFADNTLGDYLLDTSDLPMCSNCGCNTPEKPEGKPFKIVDVPFKGGEQIPQECSIYAGTIIKLPDGTYAKISCPFTGFSSLEGVNADELPGPLDGSAQFDLGLLLGLIGEDGSFVINADGSITISFKLPENSTASSYDILYWDPTLNDGEGGWFQLPPYEEGVGFEVGDDGRMIYSGVQTGGEYVTVTINFSGYFVLVSN